MWPKPSVPQTSPPGTALLQAEPRNSAPDFRFRTFEAQYILKRNSNRSAQTPACSGAPLNLGRAFDLLIVGGGINGAGIARDAAGRGLRVLLVEQNDLASGTSSASTKLIHGGLRYLEHGWFRLVGGGVGGR